MYPSTCEATALSQTMVRRLRDIMSAKRSASAARGTSVGWKRLFGGDYDGSRFVEPELSAQINARYADSIMLIVASPISFVRTATSSCRWISTQG